MSPKSCPELSGMSAASEHRPKRSFSKEGRKLLSRLAKDPLDFKQFRLEKRKEEGDNARFYLRFRLPDFEGGVRRVCREPTENLLALAKGGQDFGLKTAWFWVAQVIHYGLCKDTLRSKWRRQLIKSCKRVLRKAIKAGTLAVPAAIQAYEAQLRAEQASKTHEKEPNELRATIIRRNDEDDQKEPPNSLQHGDSDNNKVTRAIGDCDAQVPKRARNELSLSDDDEDSDSDSDSETSSDSCKNADEDNRDGTEKAVEDKGSDDSDDSDEEDHCSTDDGDTSSLGKSMSTLAVNRPTSAGVTNVRTAIATCPPSTQDIQPSVKVLSQDFKDSGNFTPAEREVLHRWRDRFCEKHNMTRAEFQVMMTLSHCPGNKDWKYDWIEKAAFMRRYYRQLPLRTPLCMQTFRTRHNWDSPSEAPLVRTTPASSVQSRAQEQAPTRSLPVPQRRSGYIGEPDEEGDSLTRALLNARARMENASIYAIRATASVVGEEASGMGTRINGWQCNATSKLNRGTQSMALDTDGSSTSGEDNSSSDEREEDYRVAVIGAEVDSDISMDEATSDDSCASDSNGDQNAHQFESSRSQTTPATRKQNVVRPARAHSRAQTEPAKQSSNMRARFVTKEQPANSDPQSDEP